MSESSGGRFLLPRRQAALLVLAAPALIAGRARAQQSGKNAGASLLAQTGTTATSAPHDPHVGPVTHLPLPRFVSLGTTRANARRGPGLSNMIDWVFVRRGMPLEVTAEYLHWRKCQDQYGEGGWILYSLLSGIRTVVVTVNMTEFLDRPETGAMVAFKAQRNVIGRLLASTKDWARVEVDGDSGWAPKKDLWGVFPSEVYR